MEIKFGMITLTCTEHEVMTMAYAVLTKYAGPESLQHWSRFDAHAFNSSGGSNFDRELAKTLFRAIGREDVFNSREADFLRELQKERDKRK